METRYLTDHEMRMLVRIFCDFPHDASEVRMSRYCQYTKENIRELQHHLRCSRLSFSPTNLCSTHKGLNQHLVNDVWAWVRHEFEDRIGPFLYPIIMSGRLTATNEWKVRQLEPVLEMWYPGFTLTASAPLGHKPIDCGRKWKVQQDQCPGCILARLGSDEKVLFALFAGMVGHFRTRGLIKADRLGGTAGWTKTKSRRIRFVRYWIEALKGGDALLSEAGELGMELRRLRREWDNEQRRTCDSAYGGDPDISLPFPVSTRQEEVLLTSRHSENVNSVRDNLHSAATPVTPDTDKSCTHGGQDRSRTVVEASIGSRQPQTRGRKISDVQADFSDPYQEKGWSRSPRCGDEVVLKTRSNFDEPDPPAAPSDFEESGFSTYAREAHMETRTAQPAHPTRASSMYSSPSVSPERLIPRPLQPRIPRQTMKASLAAESDPVPILDSHKEFVMNDKIRTAAPQAHATTRYQPSMVSTTFSYDGPGVSVVGPSRGAMEDPLDADIYNCIPTHEGLQRCKDYMAYPKYGLRDGCGGLQNPFVDEASVLPPPARTSIYRAYGTAQAKDKYASVDELDPHAEDSACV